MSIEKLKEDVSKLDAHLFKALAAISKLEKRLDAKDTLVNQLEKLIKEQNRMITILSNSLNKIQMKYEKTASHTHSDLSEIMAHVNRMKKRYE